MIYWKTPKRLPLRWSPTNDCQSITGIILSAARFVTQKKKKKNTPVTVISVSTF